MKCENARALIDSAVHSELGSVQSAALRDHLKTCTECTGIYRELEALHSAIEEAFPAQEPPPELHARLNSVIAVENPPRRSRRRLLTALTATAAVLLMLIIGLSAFTPAMRGGTGSNEAAKLDEYESQYTASAGASNAAGAPQAAPTPQEAPGEAADYGSDPEMAMEDAESSEVQRSISDTVAGAVTTRKLIQNASASMETGSFDDVLSALEADVEAAGGYLQNIDVWGVPLDEDALQSTSKQYGRTANLVARIPAERLESFLSKSEGLARVVSRSKNTNDVTASYRDVQTRLDTLTIQRERLMELLKDADNMTDIIALESELQRVQYDIEWQTQQLRGWDDLVDYSTVNISLMEVHSPDKVRSIQNTLGERIRLGFIANINGMIEGLQDFIVWFVSNLVLIIVAVVIIAVIVLTARKRLKNKV